MSKPRVRPAPATEEGTNKLCELIKEYWIKQGFTYIKATAELRSIRSGKVKASYWVISSNIGPKGYPPGPRIL